MLGFYKIKLTSKDGSYKPWLPLVAKSIGAAIVKADNICLASTLSICDGTITAIDEREYLKLLKHSTYQNASILIPHSSQGK